MDDEHDGMGHFYTGLCDIRVLACTMLQDWETKPAIYDNDKGETTPNRHPRRNRERFSTLHTARDPNKIQEVELASEDLQGMIRQPPKVGAIRSTTNRRALTLQMPMSQPLHSRASPQSLHVEDHTN